MGDILKGLGDWIKALLPALIGYLLGDQHAKANQASADAETLKTQNEIAARPDVDDADLDRWLRGE